MGGKVHEAPSVMMAHYYVVPVHEEDWVKPPFEGILEMVLWEGALLTRK